MTNLIDEENLLLFLIFLSKTRFAIPKTAIKLRSVTTTGLAKLTGFPVVFSTTFTVFIFGFVFLRSISLFKLESLE